MSTMETPDSVDKLVSLVKTMPEEDQQAFLRHAQDLNFINQSDISDEEKKEACELLNRKFEEKMLRSHGKEALS